MAFWVLYPSGVVYIKFSKTSEAAKALEEMNGKVLGNTSGNRPLKVLVASRYDLSISVSVSPPLPFPLSDFRSKKKSKTDSNEFCAKKTNR